MKPCVLAILFLIGLGFAASCSRDSPVETSLQELDVTSVAAAKEPGPKPKGNDDALSIGDMLDDPLFQALVHGIEDPSLAEPLLAAVSALEKGQMNMATNLIAIADAVAIALEDGPISEALILWSAIVRFFEEAELL